MAIEHFAINREYDGLFDGPLRSLQEKIVRCRACPRLVTYREQKALEKRPRYSDWDYWGSPVPSHGDPNGRLLLIGLAPASHGGNRTGRIFTGDPSAEFLTDALFRVGFASQPTSKYRGDGLVLIDTYELAVVRCAPPGDKPTTEEQHRCRNFLVQEIELLRNVKAVLTLGHVAFDNYLRAVSQLSGSRIRAKFRHAARYDFGSEFPTLFASYHPSPRNTNTGRLTVGGFQAVLSEIKQTLESND